MGRRAPARDMGARDGKEGTMEGRGFLGDPLQPRLRRRRRQAVTNCQQSWLLQASPETTRAWSSVLLVISTDVERMSLVHPMSL
uniref:Uncharacterized protein n=1 Tax=Oryza sativa subsp. japonica TaxID=39947 RepID=Q651U2_ORYSJ|nr:hypothetical protein [Oryza sativa Japonica Group]BAD46425.1 hypothetical protein [Oryza sativa Japonica Group]